MHTLQQLKKKLMHLLAILNLKLNEWGFLCAFVIFKKTGGAGEKAQQVSPED